jgi:hypothetical protein
MNNSTEKPLSTVLFSKMRKKKKETKEQNQVVFWSKKLNIPPYRLSNIPTHP